jgi:O-antigen/teichoic acid export membrane protein
MKPAKLIRSLTYMFFSSGCVLLISIGITLVLAKLLSPRDLGIIMSAEAFVELFIFFYNMGFRNSILKVAAADPGGFEKGLNTAVGNALVIRAIVLVPFSMALYFAAPFFIKDPTELFVSQIYVFIYALESIASVFGIIRRALGQFKLMSILDAGDKILRLIAIFVILSYFGGIILLVQIFLLEKVIRLAVSAWTTLKFVQPRVDIKLIPSMFKDSISYGIMDSFDTMLDKIDRVMLNRMIGPVAVAFYSIPAKLNRATKLVPMTITQVFLPKLHDAIVNDHTSFKKSTKHLSRFLALAGSFVFIFIHYFAEFILYKLFSDKYAESIYIVRFFAYINLIWFLQKVPELVLMSQSAHVKRAITVFMSIALNIGLNYVFISKYGLVGAVYGTIASSLVKLSFLIYFTHNYIELLKIIGIISAPLLLVYIFPVYYFIPFYIIYLLIAKLISKEDLKKILNAYKKR